MGLDGPGPQALYKRVAAMIAVLVECAEPMLLEFENHRWPCWEQTQYYRECVNRAATADESSRAPHYKTRMCRFVGAGNCHFGSDCKFAHNASELRDARIDVGDETHETQHYNMRNLTKKK